MEPPDALNVDLLGIGVPDLDDVTAGHVEFGDKLGIHVHEADLVARLGEELPDEAPPNVARPKLHQGHDDTHRGGAARSDLTVRP